MMNRGVMQRQMFSNGGEAEAQRALDIIMEIEYLIGKLPIAEKETFLQLPNSVLENTLTYVREKYGKDNAPSMEGMNKKYDEILAQDREFDIAPSAQQAIPSDMLTPEEEELLPQMGKRDPNLGEEFGRPPAPMNRMEMLKNNQAVSSGRPTPDVFSGNVGDEMGGQYRGKETFLVPGQQMPKRPRSERDEYIIQGNIPNPAYEQGMQSDLEYLQKMRRNNAPEYQGMAIGGEAVPNRLKGFSKLPESVQIQMNPQLAQRYQQGGIASMMDPASLPQGNPMMGGQMDPAQMAMPGGQMMGGMPQGGQMDPAQMAMMEAEAAGQAQGEQLGAMVGEQTMMGLDQAEDFQGAIDALRGNSIPMEGRYEELAGFVGDEDAMQTPQSVLAMVQPTIMMTEEGAVDSGIGQLMEQITGNIAMETPDGQPTAMAQGVGSLMGVGQQPLEKKLLADGGAVIGMSTGGNPFYEQALAEQQAIYGNPQDSKDAMQSRILFDIADRALLFAGGVDPNTGKNMSGAPLLSQIGRSASGLGATIGEQVSQQTAQERAMRAGALQRAQTLADRKDDKTFQLELASAKSTASKPVKLSPGDSLISSTGKVLYDKPGIYKLGEGEVVTDANGKVVAEGPKKAIKTYKLNPGEILYDAAGNQLASRPAEYTLGEGEVVTDANGKVVAEGPKKAIKTYKLNPGEKIVDVTGKEIASSPGEYTLSEGQVVTDAKGNIIAEGRDKTVMIKGIPEKYFNQLSEKEQEKVMGVTVDLDHVVINNDLIVFDKENETFSVLFDGKKERKSLKIYQDSDDRTKFYNSYDGGDNYMVDTPVTKNGITTTQRAYIPMPDNVIPVNDLEAYKVVKEEKRKQAARESYFNSISGQIENFKAKAQKTFRLDENGNRIDLDYVPPTDEQIKFAQEVLRNTQDYNDPMKMALEGTGFYGTLFSAVNNLAGFGGGYTNWIGEDTALARQHLTGLITLGRTALIISPRMPVYELQKVEQVFPSLSPGAFNAQTEANKLVTLKVMLLEQLGANKQNLTRSFNDTSIIDDIEKNNVEIQNLLHKLRGVPGPGNDSLGSSSGTGGLSDENFNEAINNISNANKNKQSNRGMKLN